MKKICIIDELNDDQLLIAESPLLSCTLVDSRSLPLLSATLFADNIVDSLQTSFDNCPKEVQDAFGDCVVYFTGYAAYASVYNQKSKNFDGLHIVTPYRSLSDISISLSKLKDEFERMSVLALIESQVFDEGD